MSVMTVSKPDLTCVNIRSKSINENGGNESIMSVMPVMTKSMLVMICENVRSNSIKMVATNRLTIECEVCDDGIQARHDMCDHQK